MVWLVWRRQRAALLVALGVVAVLAVVLVVGRFRGFSVAAELGVVSCLLPDSTVCLTPPWFAFRDQFSPFHDVVRLALMGLPVVTGVLAGAGLFGQELERGTHVVALTQAIGRGKWFGTGLLLAGLPVAVASALMVPFAAWAVAPFHQLSAFGPLSTPTFETTGLVPVGYTVLAFCFAAAAGLVLRNAMMAIVVAFALQLTVQLVLTFVVRDHYVPPVVVVFGVEQGGFVPGYPVDSGYIDAAGQQTRNPLASQGCAGGDYAGCLRAAGVTQQFISYQPESRYWLFQGIETAILLVLAGGALGAGVRGLTTRVH